METHREDRGDRIAVVAEVLSVCGTVAVVGWLPFLAREGRWAVTALVTLAVLLGSAGTLVDLLSCRRSARVRDAEVGPDRDTADGAGSGDAESSVTTVVVLGSEPAALQRASVAIAARSGPCVVMRLGTVLDDDDITSGTDARVVTGPSFEEALGLALELIDTTAVLLVSGRAVPVAESCRQAAARLDDRHPWVVGRTRPFDPDAAHHDSGGSVDAALRRRVAMHGPALWEPNATLVRTEELRRHAMTGDRPRGSWLRDRQRSGGSAARCDEVLSLVASPASPRSFWPDSFAQQRGAAADAAEATRTSTGLDRVLALLLVARESFAWALPTWFGVLFIGTVTGELPFRTAHGALPALLAAVLALRWYGLRRSLHVPAHATTDLRSTVDRIPGSIAALPSVLSARLRTGPRRVSVRPLLWVAVLTVAVLVTALVDRSPDTSMTVPAVLAALLTLLALWGLCIQVLAERGWDRTTYRIDLDLPATYDGHHVRVLNGSPGGMAVERTGSPAAAPPPGSPAAAPSPGSRGRIRVDLDDATCADLDVRVAWTRHHGDAVLTGLAVDADAHTSSAEAAEAAAALGAWTAQLVRAAVATDGPTHHQRGSTTRRHAGRDVEAASWSSRIGDIAAIGSAALLSLALLAVLGAAMLGLQVAVVRSASMTPTIAQGAVVVSESVPAGRLRPGDVVTRPASTGSGPVTHRLVAARPNGDRITMVTRGDANQGSETWTVPARSKLQRVRWVVPTLGDAVSAARSNLGLLVVAVAGLGLLLAAGRLPRRDDAHREGRTVAA